MPTQMTWLDFISTAKLDFISTAKLSGKVILADGLKDC